jgi:peptidyl-prolyl cis-trans isomerase A (cyclophilin A)
MSLRATCFSAVWLSILLAVFAAASAGGPAQGVPAKPTSTTPPADEALPAGLPEGWYARIETSAGIIVARLLPEQAPRSVAYFAALAEGRQPWPDPITGETRRDPYYDGVIVHRVVAAERFEVGDHTGTGRGSPPFYVPPEDGQGPIDFSAPGRLGMTRSTLNRISGVQFFVTAGTLPWLNRVHPCFGTVVAGSDVVWSISSLPARGDGRPLDPVTIVSVRIRKVGSPDPLPDPQTYSPQLVPFGLKTK